MEFSVLRHRDHQRDENLDEFHEMNDEEMKTEGHKNKIPGSNIILNIGNPV